MNNEDIEILEKLINVYKELKKDFEEGHASSYEMQFEDFKALENLITRYKQLEAYYKCEKNLFDDYIPKSKVKEKIEEINNENLNYSENEYYLENEIKGYAMEHLRELLREE